MSSTTSAASSAEAGRFGPLVAITTVVGRKGFRATSLSDIAPVARVSRSDFYARYENLEVCLAAAFDAGAARLLAAVAEADDPGAAFPVRLEAALAAALDLLASDPPLATLLALDFLPGSEALPDRYYRLLWRLAARRLGRLPQRPSFALLRPQIHPDPGPSVSPKAFHPQKISARKRL